MLQTFYRLQRPFPTVLSCHALHLYPSLPTSSIIPKMEVDDEGSSSTVTVCCQVENCTSDLSEAKRYHQRHKVCEFHAKAPVVLVSGLRQRFCQQCSRFQELGEFDDTKRSCRRRLDGHNKRRRRTSSDATQRETSN